MAKWHSEGPICEDIPGCHGYLNDSSHPFQLGNRWAWIASVSKRQGNYQRRGGHPLLQHHTGWKPRFPAQACTTHFIPFADPPYTHTIFPGSWPRRPFQRPPFSQRPSRPIQPRRCQEFIETPPGWVPAARLAPPITLVPGCRTISAARQRSWATAVACWWTGDSTTAAGKILQSEDSPHFLSAGASTNAGLG